MVEPTAHNGPVPGSIPGSRTNSVNDDTICIQQQQQQQQQQQGSRLMKDKNLRLFWIVTGMWLSIGAVAIAAPSGQPVFSQKIVGPFAHK